MALIKDEQTRMRMGLRPLVGTVVGVGIFALPYVFAQVGWRIGLIVMIVVAVIQAVVLLAYAEMALQDPTHRQARFIGVVGRQLGLFGEFFAGGAFFALQWGAMLAYVIAGGVFMQTAFGGILGGGSFVFSLVFWLVSSLFMIGGVRFAAFIDRFLIPTFFALLVILAILARPYLHGAYLLPLHPEKIWGAVGVLLFAFHGFSAIPEMRDLVHASQKPLYRAIVWGMALVVGIYALFTATVVGVTGRATTIEALLGLRDVSPVFATIGCVAGILIVMTAFLNIGDSVKQTLVHDLRLGYLPSWIIASGVPLVMFLLGVRQFIGVIGFTGGVLGSLCALMVIVAYERLRLSHQLPKYALRLPQWSLMISFLVFLGSLFWSIR